MFKLEDVIETIQFKYWTKSEGMVYSNIHEFNDWYHNDDSFYGQCFTLVPSHEHIQHGIKSLSLKMIVNSTIFIHTPGMLKKGSDQLAAIHYVENRKVHMFQINYEIHELLDYGGDPCNNDKTYQLDGCYSKETEKKSLDTVGCTTPYAMNKTNICTDSNKGEAAHAIYDKFMFYSSENNHEECYSPCTYFIVSSKTPVSDLTKSGVYFYFPQLIQETKTHYTYSELSLIAEIGGYVGLFLGISINQITNLVDILVVRIRSLFTLQ